MLDMATEIIWKMKFMSPPTITKWLRVLLCPYITHHVVLAGIAIVAALKYELRRIRSGGRNAFRRQQVARPGLPG
jgi:hypothetical protein